MAGIAFQAGSAGHDEQLTGGLSIQGMDLEHGVEGWKRRRRARHADV